MLRNLGSGKFSDATKDTKLDEAKLTEPIAVAAADVSRSGGIDLVITQAGGAPLLLRNQGAEKNGWLEIDLKALNDNRSAIGTKVEVFAGELYQKFERVAGPRRPRRPKGRRRGTAAVADRRAAGRNQAGGRQGA